MPTADPAPPSLSPSKGRPTVAAVVAAVVLASVAVRVLSLTGIPLLITNDGAWYIDWAHRVLAGDPMGLPPYRTPGYPYFLAGLFALFGSHPMSVLIAQHAMGIATAGLVALTAARLGGGACGLVVGLLAAFDPVLLAFESMVLTESLAAFLLILLVSLAVLPSRRPLLRGAAVGLVLAALCLVRPSFQLFAPFAVAAVALAGGSVVPRPVRYRAAACAALALLLGLSPWLVANAREGTTGLSTGNGVFLWIGIAQSGLLDDEAPCPEPIRSGYRETVGTEADDARIHRFLADVGAWRSREVGRCLSSWALASIRNDPTGYARSVGYAVLWQLGAFPARGGYEHNEIRWLIARLGRDGRDGGPGGAGGAGAPNFQHNQPVRGLDHFAMGPPSGPLAFVFERFAGALSWCGPRLCLFAIALIAMAACAHARRWPLFLMMAGSIAFMLVHAAFLMPCSRYSLPAWIAWSIGIAPLAGREGTKGRRDEGRKGLG